MTHYTNKISIIIPTLNDNEELNNTINDIYRTANENFEIIIIDDCSKEPVNIKNSPEIKIKTNKKRIGVDGCRQLGSKLATSNNLFIIDSHMRFFKGWMSEIIKNIEEEKTTLWCTTCIGLGFGNMNLHESKDKYKGANFIIKKNGEILEPKWRNKFGNGKYEIPCVLGANYGISKEWFDYIHGLEGLKMWGSSEIFISLKSWLAGGKCKIDSNIKIGHKFRNIAPYSTSIWNLYYNKIFICKTILPKKIGDDLIDSMKKNTAYKKALQEIEINKNFIEKEKTYYDSIFKMKFEDLCEKFEE